MKREYCKPNLEVIRLEADENIALDIKKLQESSGLNFYQKMVFDNLICEYNNFISLLEGLERAC